MTAEPRRIGVVVSALDDAESIDELARRLDGAFQQCPSYEWEVILVDNGSGDETFQSLETVCDRDSRFNVVQLARRFDDDASFTAGMATLEADAVVLMHADLKDPPEMIPEFVTQWEAGFENVYAVDAPAGPGQVPTGASSRLLGRLAGKLTGGLVPPGTGDFRLLDRRVYEQVRSMKERNRAVSGLAAWVGFRSSGVERRPGQGSADPWAWQSLQRKAKAIFAHSQVPLVVIPLAGIGLSALAFLALLGLTIDWMTRGVPFPGFGTIVALMILLFGILFCMLGIMSIYIGLIYEETKGRPNFVIRRKVGFTSDRRRTAGNRASTPRAVDPGTGGAPPSTGPGTAVWSDRASRQSDGQPTFERGESAAKRAGSL